MSSNRDNESISNISSKSEQRLKSGLRKELLIFNLLDITRQNSKVNKIIKWCKINIFECFSNWVYNNIINISIYNATLWK